MKRAYLTATALKTFFRHAAFASFLTIAAVTAASAQKVSDSTASVSYQGYANDQFAFLMKYDNETGEKFSIVIKDSDGITLYNESFTDKKFSRVFKSHLETGSLTFLISNPKKKEEMKFKVNAQRHEAEEFSITKAN